MNLDMATLVFVVGVAHALQMLVFLLQYLTNKNYPGIGYWLLWCAAETAGFGCALLRTAPSLGPPVIVCQNLFLVAGVILLYIGIMRFLDRQESRTVLGSFLALLLVTVLYSAYGDHDAAIRSMMVCFVLALISFFSAHALFAYKFHSISGFANFAAFLFSVHGSYFALRGFMILAGAPADFSVPTPFNVAAFLDAMVVSILWTFVLIAMVNRRLHAEMTEAKKEMELVFNTSPDAAVITRLGDGMIAYVNQGFSALSGFSRDELIGKTTLEANIWQSEADRLKIVAELQKKGFCENAEAVFRRKDGTCVNGLVSAKTIDLQGIPHIISVTKDITAHKRADDKIRSLLTEKEILLREVHHRIKNNMNTVMSLLNLQADTLSDPSAVSSLHEARSRVGSMMLLYDRLYRSADFRQISAAEYLASLVDDIIRTFPSTASVTTSTHYTDCLLDAKVLSPLGIILNELITNSLKHAFDGKDSGTITVSFEVEGGRATLTVEDDGVGFPESLDPASSAGFGLQLVTLLAEQLDGTIRLERDKGSRFVLECRV